MNSSIRPEMNLISMCEEVTRNFEDLQQEWATLKTAIQRTSSHAQRSAVVRPGEVRIQTDKLLQLQSLTTELQNMLPAILHSAVTTASTTTTLQQDVSSLQKKTAELAAECLQWKHKFSAASSDCQKEKQEVCELQQEVGQLWEQFKQQSEFSSSLGAATATLLWRVSRNQDTIPALLGGSKVEEFLALTCSTVNSYVEAYGNDWPQKDTNESGFILALCGTITNIAASSYGRDFVMGSENGQRLIDTFVSFLSQAPLKSSAKMKSLMLMGLYNVSINQKGVQYLMKKPGMLSLLAWHLKEETDVNNRINTLRLLQSIVAECDTSTSQSFLQPIPQGLLRTLTKDRNTDIKDLATELLADLTVLFPEH